MNRKKSTKLNRTVTPASALDRLLTTWKEYQKTGRIEAEQFSRHFTDALKTASQESVPFSPALRQLLDIWDIIFKQEELRQNIYRDLPLNVAEDFLAQLCQKFSRENVSSSQIQKWIGFLLFSFKQADWREKIYREEKTDQWFSTYLKLIETGNFNVGSLLNSWNNFYQHKVAFKHTRAGRTVSITWEELWEKINRIGMALRNHFQQTRAHPHIAIISENRPEMVLADLACLTFGVVDIMVPVNAVPEDMAYIIEDSDASLVFVSNEKILEPLLPYLSRLKKVGKIVVFDSATAIDHKRIVSYKDFLQNSDIPAENELNHILRHIKTSNLATIMYTSGTTGKPKGIMFSHLNIVSKRFARSLVWPSLGEHDLFISYLPLYHTFGRWLEMMGSLFWGATYLFAQSPSINSLLKEMQTHHPSIFISIPQKWQQIYEFVAGKVDLERAGSRQIYNTLHHYTGGELRLGLSAAGYLAPEIFKFFQQNGVELMSGFGMTEATGGITMTPIGGYKENSLGKALPGIELQLAEDGELLIRGPYVMMGYWKLPPGESAFDKEGWLHTGDIMRQDKDGYYFIVDRKKEIYKNIKGQTIAPQRIENMFRDIEAVKRVFLVGDQREYNTLLIYPNYEYSELNLRGMSREELHEFMRSLVISVNQFLAPYERIVQFSIIDRDFSAEMGELTPKKTYRRKVIEKNFRKIIEQMYDTNFVKLNFRQFRLIFPNWLLRELGVLSDEVKIDGSNKLIIQGIPVLELEEHPEDSHLLRIGNLWYRLEKKSADLGELLSLPPLWLTNQQLVNLTQDRIFNWNRYQEPSRTISLVREKPAKIQDPSVPYKVFELLRQSNIHNLRGLHFSGLVIQTGDEKQAEKAIDYLEEILHTPTNALQPYARQLIRMAVMNPHSGVKRRAFLSLNQVVSPEEWLDLFKHFFQSDPAFLNKNIINKICETNFSQAHFEKLLQYAENITNLSFSSGNQRVPVRISNLFRFLREYSSRHPIMYKKIRQFFTLYRMDAEHPELAKEAAKALEKIQYAFRRWLGSNSPVAIDPDLGQEYSWEQVIVFDDNVPENHTYFLLKLISQTPFIREALFLFTGHIIINLKDLPPGGIWIPLLGTLHGKSVYRISVQTRYQGRYDIAANLNQSLPEEEVEEEIAWLIICGARANLPQLVEDFGGYWPEYHTWSEEFIPGETVSRFFKRVSRKLDEYQKERLKNLWPYIIWSACKAYVDFWNRTGRRYEVADPSPENIIVPHHDYQTGSRIVSISARLPHTSLWHAIINFYEHFIRKLEQEYPFLQNGNKWQYVFSPILEILGEKEGLRYFRETDTSSLPASPGKELRNALNEYLEGVHKRGFIPKQLYFAIKRFNRWKKLNPEATANAEASNLHELYRTYQLERLENAYPETRIRFYRETVFRESGKELQRQLDHLIRQLRKNQLDRDQVMGFISHMQANMELSDREKYLITRMGYTHLAPSDAAELMSQEIGEKAQAALVVTFTDREGEQIRVRNPLNPREVARLHRLFHQFNLPVSFQPEDRFLLAFNERDHLVGGLFYYPHDQETVHLEKIVVADHYRRKGVSEGLLNEFFKRMRGANYRRVKTGFFRPEFFYRFGFRIEKGYAGLVKNLAEEK